MKKIHFLILMVLSVGMFIVSCSSDDNGTTTTPDDKTNSAPVITNGTTTTEVDEDADGTLTIFTVTATDADADDTLVFEITGGNGEGLFSIDQNGLVTLADGKYLDFETATEHSITVTVSDGNGGTDEITVQIAVQNVIEDLFEDPASFIFTVETVVANEQFDLEIYGEDVDFQIDWGDGQELEHVTAEGNPFHEFQTQGTYTVALKGQLERLTFLAEIALRTVEQWGNTEWKSMKEMFYLGNNNIVTINATDKPNLAQCTSFNSAFINVDFKQDITGWDVGQVTNMFGTFANNVTFDQDISGWDVGQVTNMGSMFFNAESFNQPIGDNWDVGNVQTMEGMFQDATAFDQNLGAWNIGNVTNMINMFGGSGMSATNFSNTLIGWSDQEVQLNVSLDAQGVDLCEGDGFDAFVTLTGSPNWTIIYGNNASCN
ncbi:MAG: BspA family leucine-rich repeat surface protein [Bacteroidota bacterium]